MVVRLELGRRHVGAGCVQAAGVPEIDPAGRFDLLDVAPFTAAADEFALVEPDDALGQGDWPSPAFAP
jgi:hypothetical protein